MVPTNFVTWLLGFLISLLGGCWAIFKYFEARLEANKEENDDKMKRLYERLDENKKTFYNDFVLKAVLEEYNKARKEIIDQKFDSLVQLFTEKFDGLRAEIKNLGKNNNHI